MKILETVAAVFVVAMLVTVSRAEDGGVDFDGIRQVPSFSESTTLFRSFRETEVGTAETPDVGTPVIVDGPLADIDRSILRVIKYGEQNKIPPAIVASLKKLVILGTKDEKTEFMNSERYIFPRRFADFESTRAGELSELLKSRGYETHCWEDNCRMVQVCNDKKSCERSCELLGVTCAAAGTMYTQSYTGGVFPSASAAVGAAAGMGCRWACEAWVCDNIPDCYEVQKCDSHCETIPVSGGTDQIDPNTGLVQHS